jgi:ankyrin repeat protein
MTMMLTILLAASVSNSEKFLNAVAQRDVEVVREMLKSDPSLANAKRESGVSAVTLALFALRKGEQGFPNPVTNATLHAILGQKPQLSQHEVAALGTPQELGAIISAKPEAVKELNQFGWSMLHLAAYAGNAANTELLIRSGANVNLRARSRFKNTPLQTALLTGQYATAKILIEHGADVLVRQAHGATPMHEAALLGRADIIELLLGAGAEINSMSDNGRTPLAEAIRGHHEDVAAMLRAKGAVLGPTPDEEEPKKK